MRSVKYILSAKTSRRDKLAIVAEILEIAKEGTLKTQIMYKANLSFSQLNDYLTFLLNNNLLALSNLGGKEIYVSTKIGSDFLQRHSELTKLLKENSKGSLQGKSRKQFIA